jgi:hypothetical protein
VSRAWCAALAIAVLAAIGLAVTEPAGAEIEGPCQATIAGRNVATADTSATGEPIEVRENARVPVTMTATRELDQLKVELEVAGLRWWVVHDEPTDGTTWTRIVDMGDYSDYGVGLYEIVASTGGQGFSCTGSALVDVQGDSPLRTVAGLVGLGLAVVGGLGLLWVLIRGPAGAPLVGAILGVLLGAGVAVLLQQFAVVYPTLAAAIIALGGGAVLGLLFGLFGTRGRPRY